MLWLLWVILPLLVLLMLSFPIRIALCANATARFAVLHIKIRMLLIQRSFYLRISYLLPPVMTLTLCRDDGSVWKRLPLIPKKKTRFPLDAESIQSAIRVNRLSIDTVAGIREAPVATVCVLAVFRILFDFLFCRLLPDTVENSAYPAFTENLLRIKLEGIVTVFPVKLAMEYICRRKRKKINGTSN